MNYKIEKLCTEKLEISSFAEKIDQNDEINLIINFRTSVEKIKKDPKNIIFKMNYVLHSDNAPIFLNWGGSCFIKLDEKLPSDFDPKEFLENEDIKNFLNEVTKKLSFFINGSLPTFDEMKGI